jgi:hypothetical protein
VSRSKSQGLLLQLLGFAQHRCGRPEVPTVEEVGKELFEDTQYLIAHLFIRVDLHQVEQDVERAGANVPAILGLELSRHVAHLALIEEVERRVEVIDGHHSFGSRLSLLGRLRLPLLRSRLAAGSGSRRLGSRSPTLPE